MSRTDNDAVTVLGETNFRNRHRMFGIKTDDRRRHVYVIGKTGVGKTNFIATQVVQDIADGKGLALVDPHGDVADHILDFVPKHRVNDVVYFDPSDAERPIAFNVLETVDPSHPSFTQEKNLVSSGLVGVFKKIWADSWGPRLEYILRNTILALLDNPGNTLLGIPRLYVDKAYRKRIVENIKDPVVKGFWVDEFANYNDRFRAEAISPIQNKVGQFLSSSVIRNIVGQPKSTIDLGSIMNEGKILIMNLSKGKVGEDNASLLGAMMITKIQLAAMDRAKIPEEERKDFYLYVDEFQNFATESFAVILSEARKYRLSLILAHQYIAQMAEEVRDAVFGNLGTIIVFRVGALDAEYLEPEFMPVFNQTDMVNLPNYNAYIKLMIDGMTSRPFSMATLPLSLEPHGTAEKVLQVSRERYSRPRQVVEEKISRWSGVMYKGEEERKEQARPQKQRREQPSDIPAPARLKDAVLTDSKKGEDVIQNLSETLQKKEEGKRLKKMWPTTCDRCGKTTELPFKPTPGKEKYCKECFDIVRADRKKVRAEK